MKQVAHTIPIPNGEIRLTEDSISVYQRAADGRLEFVEKHALKSEWVKVWPAPESGGNVVEGVQILKRAQEIYRSIHSGGCKILSLGDECKCLLCQIDGLISELAEEPPTLASLAGIAPYATGDLSSEEFVRQIRAEWGGEAPENSKHKSELPEWYERAEEFFDEIRALFAEGYAAMHGASILEQIRQAAEREVKRKD